MGANCFQVSGGIRKILSTISKQQGIVAVYYQVFSGGIVAFQVLSGIVAVFLKVRDISHGDTTLLIHGYIFIKLYETCSM